MSAIRARAAWIDTRWTAIVALLASTSCSEPSASEGPGVSTFATGGRAGASGAPGTSSGGGTPGAPIGQRSTNTEAGGSASSLEAPETPPPVSSNAGAAGADAGAAQVDAGTSISTRWDWTGIVGTGQSLSVGEPDGTRGMPIAAAHLTTQPFQNLSLSTGTLAWPVDANDASLRLIPLVEPIGRPSTAYPSSWPTNIAGETHHAAMANQITTLVQAAGGGEYVTIHSAVGENGQCLSFLIKGAVQMGVNGHAYQATIIEATAINRLARAAGKTYGVGAITVTHGECDAGNANYETQLHQLWSDYATDLAAITGQLQRPLLIVSQQHSSGNDRTPSTIAEWKIGVDYPSDAVCSGPKYQYSYTPDGVHLLVAGYEQMGEKYAQVYTERVVLGHDWQPLQPSGVERNGNVITVHFHVPVPPLAWEDTFPLPHQANLTQWSAGKGFEVRSGNTPITIASVDISGQDVQITCSDNLPASGLTVGYALSADPTAMTTPHPGTTRWGLLRDSDPFVGQTTSSVQHNFAVAFELPVP